MRRFNLDVTHINNSKLPCQALVSFSPISTPQPLFHALGPKGLPIHASNMRSLISSIRPRPLHSPRTSLCLCFVVWKFLLFCIVLISPGAGYDTSTTLLCLGGDNPKPGKGPLPGLQLWLQKLVRWDAIYFTAIARRGYLWEQEWAFGWGQTKLISFVAQGTINQFCITAFQVAEY